MQRLEQEQVNANEMADLMILFDSGRIYEHSEEIATMLRQQQEKLTKYELRHVAQRDRIAILEMQHKQQQAEIEALKLQLHTTLTNRDLRTYDGKLNMNNEPVAWFEQDPDMKSVWYQADQDSPNAIPLYTHPAKTLTDEEIIDIWSGMETDTGEQNIIFARAILRKAQEK